MVNEDGGGIVGFGFDDGGDYADASVDDGDGDAKP